MQFYIFSSYLLCPFRWPVSLQEGPGLLCGQRRTAAIPRRPENTLLNDVFFYVIYHMSSFQNMHEYQVTKDTEIFEFVHTSSPAIPNTVIPETYKISKQLVAYLETLVAFSSYYVAGDSRYVAGDSRKGGLITSTSRHLGAKNLKRMQKKSKPQKPKTQNP
jgi:hypothetical protein